MGKRPLIHRLAIAMASMLMVLLPSLLSGKVIAYRLHIR